MKFLHTADLHIGKQLNDVSLLEDQKFILAQIVDIAKRKNVDVVLISGDVYQKQSPQSEAMNVFDEFISELVSMNKTIFIISGNHDSAQRISYFSSLIRKSGVFVSEKFDGKLQSYTLNDENGEIIIHLMPFIKPVMVKKYFPEAKMNTYEDAIKVILQNSPIDTKKRNILLCHQFITGAETCDSEEFAVGGLDNISAHVFDEFDYVALGHIHRSQKVLRDTLNYAGSPLKYSFSEVNHKKSVTIVDFQEKGDVTIQKEQLYPIHDLRIIEGKYSDIMNMDYSEDYVWVTLNDEIVSPDAKVSLSTVFPNIMKMTVVNSKTKYDIDVQAKESMENKNIEELFCDFYRLQNNDQMPSKEHLKVLEEILKEMEGSEK